MLLVLLAAFAMTIGIALLLYLAQIVLRHKEPSESETLFAGLLMTAVFEGCLVLFSYRFALRRHGLGYAGLGFRSFGRREAVLALQGLIVAWSVLIAYIVVVEMANLDLFRPESTLAEELFDRPSTIVAAGIVAVLVAPLAEEAYFRGCVFAGLAPRWGFWPAALASALLFSLAHVNLGSLLPFTIIGLVFAWLYYRSHTLWTSVAVHFLSNLTSFSIAVVLAMT